MNWKKRCLPEKKINFSLIYQGNEAAVLLMGKGSEAVYLIVKHTYKVNKLMEIYYSV